ncbi:MAG: hypothetical protein OHK0053_05880 [Microscillaceae bacterium]
MIWALWALWGLVSWGWVVSPPAYFKEIVFNSELGAGAQRLSKWQKPIRIALEGPFAEAARPVLPIIIKEMEDLTGLSISLCAVPQMANLWIYVGSREEFLRRTALPASKLGKNEGFFYLRLGPDYEIEQGHIFIAAQNQWLTDIQAHLLREELTQALGLVNDSWHCPHSIFYQGWTQTQSWAAIDRWLIRHLYHPKLTPGMTWAEAAHFLVSN